MLTSLSSSPTRCHTCVSTSCFPFMHQSVCRKGVPQQLSVGEITMFVLEPAAIMVKCDPLVGKDTWLAASCVVAGVTASQC